MEDVPAPGSPRRSVRHRMLLVCAAIFAAMAVGEAVLRLCPVRGTGYGTRVYDPDIKLYKFTPGSKVVVTNVRDERIVRDVNNEGWLDVEHTPEKPEGVCRIGFFGDSYVEAVQVVLEDTFFRIVGKKLSARGVEALAFGHSGHGPIHNCLVSRKYAPHYDLDYVIYVFFDNDPGDQVETIKAAWCMPYAKLVEGKVVVDDSLQSAERTRPVPQSRFAFLNRSALYRNTYLRLKLKLDAQEASERPGIPDQNDPPSTWPEHFRKEAKELAEAVIKEWADAEKAEGRQFAVFYVPMEGQFTKKDEAQDTWKHWLKTYCAREGIDFIDACAAFTAAEAKGEKMHDDHFSAAGHRVFAEVFADWFEVRR